jgi:hypothetical protein
MATKKDDKHQESQKEQYRKMIREIVDKYPKRIASASYNATVQFKADNAAARKAVANPRATLSALQSAYNQLNAYFTEKA